MAYEELQFAGLLRAFVDGYQGAHERAVLRAPEVFDLFARLFSSDQLDRSSRQVINAVLAYFVAPGDALPECTLGPYGLLDDLYVAAHAFRLLRREIPADIMDEAWRGEGDLDEVMSVVFSESRSAVGKKGREALRLAALTG
jgi:uncharacterized membrane protein YkvA (DUF1232 family)